MEERSWFVRFVAAVFLGGAWQLRLATPCAVLPRRELGCQLHRERDAQRDVLMPLTAKKKTPPE